MNHREVAVWLIVGALGATAGYYVGGWWLRRQWEKFLEGE